MTSKLKVAIISLDIVPGNKAQNLKNLCDLTSKLQPGCDLITLPELFSTGFTSDKEKLATLAETNNGDTIACLQKITKQHNAAISGSFLARTATKIYNRSFFIEPSEENSFYDKRHLFSMSSESRCLEKGITKAPVVRFRGWNIATVICYDLRFPVWCRNYHNAYDLLLVPANWPAAREYAWTHLLKARAIENQAYVIGTNRSGNDKFGIYDGLSTAIDFQGRTIKATGKAGHIEYVEIDRASLEKWRDEFSVWKDADEFNIDLH